MIWCYNKYLRKLGQYVKGTQSTYTVWSNKVSIIHLSVQQISLGDEETWMLLSVKASNNFTYVSFQVFMAGGVKKLKLNIKNNPGSRSDMHLHNE
jgi:hypothetical protein